MPLANFSKIDLFYVFKAMYIGFHNLAELKD